MPKYWFHHVHAVSEDFMKAAEFYEKFFGAKKVRIVKENVDLDLNGTIIKIRSPRPDALVPEAAVGKGLEHISLGTDNVEEAVKELQSILVDGAESLAFNSFEVEVLRHKIPFLFAV